MPKHLLDVVIVGAGPAGLSAALVLGRCLRNVVVLDTDRPRNAASHAVHGFLTRDGIPPRELRRIGREQLKPYRTVKLARIEVTSARRVGKSFEVSLKGGRRVRSRTLLLATGVVDDVPQVEGLLPLYGRSVFHCPYCDGWERRHQPIAIYGRGVNGHGLALELKAWSNDLALCTDGPGNLQEKHLRRLARHGISVHQQRIVRLEGRGGQLARIVFDDGTAIERRAMFFSSGQRQSCGLASGLGCGFTGKGAVRTGKYEATDIPGLYVAGDASRLVQMAIVAAAEGAQAAFAINTALLKVELA
ncbi:MAG TPA: NAD(P)/FAD-dependent oxidoreductase [Vicinamibacterales bacterium]|nr:NAD(P)/FAD-dependent oxidoreductase [Vicinamibacterales bacterium]